MDSLRDVIEMIRQRPALILSRPSARTLYAFLSGYEFARRDRSDRDFMAGFGNYVHERYDITSTQGWAQIIEFYSTSEAGEMDLFWKLMDEYMAQGTAKRRKVS